MATTKWRFEDTITEVELARQATVGAITEMLIEQTANGYNVIVLLKWHPERVALRTRRAENEPREFKSLERLVAFVRDRFPAIREAKLVLLPASKKRL